MASRTAAAVIATSGSDRPASHPMSAPAKTSSDRDDERAVEENGRRVDTALKRNGEVGSKQRRQHSEHDDESAERRQRERGDEMREVNSARHTDEHVLRIPRRRHRASDIRPERDGEQEGQRTKAERAQRPRSRAA